MIHLGLTETETLFADSSEGRDNIARAIARHYEREAYKGRHASPWSPSQERRAIVEGALVHRAMIVAAAAAMQNADAAHEYERARVAWLVCTGLPEEAMQ